MTQGTEPPGKEDVQRIEPLVRLQCRNETSDLMGKTGIMVVNLFDFFVKSKQFRLQKGVKK